MAGETTTPFAVNTGGPISGTDQVGNIAIGTTAQDYSENPGGVTWWMGPDQNSGYVIAQESILLDQYKNPVLDGNGDPIPAPMFWRTTARTDESLVSMVNFLQNKYGEPISNNAQDATAWLQNYGLALVTASGNGVGTPGHAWFVSTGLPNGNIAYLILDYSNGTISLHDTGYNFNDWSEYDYAVMQNGAFMYMLQDQNNYDHYVMYFIDPHGVLISTHEFTSTSFDYGHLNGFGFWFFDNDNGTFKICDGVNVVDKPFNPSQIHLYQIWDYDVVNSAHNFIIREDDQAGPNRTVKVTGTDGSQTTLFSYDSSLYSYDVRVTPDADFIVVYKWNYGSSQYDRFQIYTADGTVLKQDVDLSAQTYRSYNDAFYGAGHYVAVLYDYNNTSLDYLMLNYQGTNTNHLTQATHAYGADYPDFDLRANGLNFWNNDGRTSTAAHVVFHDYPGATADPGNNLYAYSYVDVVSFYPGTTTPAVTVLASGPAQYISVNSIERVSGDALFLFKDNGSNGVVLLTIHQAGNANASTTETSAPFMTTTAYYETNYSVIGNGKVKAAHFINAYPGNPGSAMVTMIMDRTGILTSRTSSTLNNSGYWQTYHCSDLVTYDDGTDTWWYSPTQNSGQFNVMTGVTNYTWVWTPTQYELLGQPRTKAIVMMDPNIWNWMLFTESGMTTPIPVPSSNPQVAMGKDAFMIKYTDSGSNTEVVNIYDYTQTVVGQIGTGATNKYDYEMNFVEDRGYLSVPSPTAPGNRDYYLINADGTYTKNSDLSDNYPKYYTSNDYIDWD